MAPPVLARRRYKRALVILAVWCVVGVVQALGDKQWCLARKNANKVDLGKGLEWACKPEVNGGGGANCAPIQKGGPCYEPDTLVFHACYAFNSYWQENKAQKGTTCDFGGVAYLQNEIDPSRGSCHYPDGPTLVPARGPASGPAPATATGGGGSGAGVSRDTALKIVGGCLSAAVTVLLAAGAFVWRSKLFRNEKLLILTAAGKLLSNERERDGSSEDKGLTAIKLDIARMTLNCWDGMTLGPKRDFNMQPVGIWEERFRHKRAALLLWAVALYDERRSTQGLPPLLAMWRDIDKAAKKRFAHDIAMIVVTVDYDVLSKELAVSDLPTHSTGITEATRGCPLAQDVQV